MILEVPYIKHNMPWFSWDLYALKISNKKCSCFPGKLAYRPGNKNKGKGNDIGLAWDSQVHCFADRFFISHAHFFVTDTQHNNSVKEIVQKMSSIIMKLEIKTSSLLYTINSLHDNLAYTVDLNV